MKQEKRKNVTAKKSPKDRKLDAFKKANVAMLFLTPQERECVIKATAIIYGVSW